MASMSNGVKLRREAKTDQSTTDKRGGSQGEIHGFNAGSHLDSCLRRQRNGS